MRARTLLVAVMLLVVAVGCNRAEQADEEATALKPEDYGALPGLKAAKSEPLQQELQRLVAERATPELLIEREVAKADNVAAGLAGLLDGEPRAIYEKSNAIFPAGQFEFNPLRLQKAINFLKQYEAAGDKARAALRRPQCNFEIPFLTGALAGLGFIEEVRVYAHIEAFRAARALAEDDPDEAIVALGFMFRLARCLDGEKNVDTRLEAAEIRGEAFRVLGAIARHEKTDRARLVRLRAVVKEQLAGWPDDADAWIGERARGLYAYELVRDGKLLAVLKPEDAAALLQQSSEKALLAATARNVDADELYYLGAMRRIIERCRQPHFARVELFDAIASDLQQKRNDEDFPLVAAQVLLRDIRPGHERQARDRANWEAWSLALAAATGGPVPDDPTNPLTGEDYRCDRRGEFIAVDNFGTGTGGDHPKILVPDRSEP